MPISETTYQQVALEDDSDKWELVCGRLRAKPPMTTEHGQIGRRLVRRLNLQLVEEEYAVGRETPKLRVPGGNYRIPDVCVILVSLIERRRHELPFALELYVTFGAVWRRFFSAIWRSRPEECWRFPDNGQFLQEASCVVVLVRVSQSGRSYSAGGPSRVQSITNSSMSPANWGLAKEAIWSASGITSRL